MGKKYKSKYISATDMYRNKHKSSRRSSSVPTGCMVAILQYLSVGALFALCLSMVF